jgi:membrane protease subunit HflK
VVKPEDFLFSIEADHVVDAITAVARSTMHRIVGDYSADEILTGKREEVGLAALKEMQNILAQYECGVEIIDLQMQRVTPPERVKPAFDEVNASIQRRDQLVNEANQVRNKLIPLAEAQRDKLIRQAEGYAARRRAEAEGEIAALLAKYHAYKEAPDITRKRLYLEAMEQVITNSGPKTVLDGELGGVIPLLNLGEVGQSASPNQQEQTR